MTEKIPAKCPCRWIKCKRYGKCGECIAHHSKSLKHPLPYCKNNKKDTRV